MNVTVASSDRLGIGVTKDSAATARLLLRQMRKPQETFTRVTETCLVGEGELIRRIHIEVQGEFDRLVTDLVHPTKGAHVDLRLLDPATVRRLEHSEHIRVTQSALLFRIESARRSINIPKGMKKKFKSEWSEFAGSLMQLPNQDPKTAAETVKSAFDESTKLPNCLTKVPNIGPKSTEKLRRLYDLAQRLVERYLLLVELNPKNLAEGRLSFEYRHAINEQRFRRDKPIFRRRSKRHHVKYADQEQSRPRRRIHYGSVPVSFRIHMPWVKRCNHYTLSLEAGSGYFIAFQHALEKPPFEVPRLLTANEPAQPRFSISTEQGRRVSLFVTNGRGTRYPTFLAVRHEEIPGRMTARAFRLSWFVALVLLVFGVQSYYFDHETVTSTASLFVAILALGAFASAPQPGPGVMGYPLFARFAPVALGFNAALFALWLSMDKSAWPSMSVPFTLTLNKLVAAAKDYGSIALVAPTLVVAIILTVRRRKIANRYLAVQSAPAKTSDNFFTVDGDVTL